MGFNSTVKILSGARVFRAFLELMHSCDSYRLKSISFMLPREWNLSTTEKIYDGRIMRCALNGID